MDFTFSRVASVAGKTLEATAAADEQSPKKGRRAHKYVGTKERLQRETSFWSHPAEKELYHLDSVKKMQLLFTTSLPQAAVSQWSMENCKSGPIADQPSHRFR